MFGIEKITDVNPDILNKFEATFAKWRYETIARVMKSLLFLRRLCQCYMKQMWFNNPQDAEEIKAVLDACSDSFLWSFMQVAYKEVFAPMEGQRHWGMVCPCANHKADRREGKKVICFQASRRIHEVPEFIDKNTARFFGEGRQNHQGGVRGQ